MRSARPAPRQWSPGRTGHLSQGGCWSPWVLSPWPRGAPGVEPGFPLRGGTLQPVIKPAFPSHTSQHSGRYPDLRVSGGIRTHNHRPRAGALPLSYGHGGNLDSHPLPGTSPTRYGFCVPVRRRGLEPRSPWVLTPGTLPVELPTRPVVTGLLPGDTFSRLPGARQRTPGCVAHGGAPLLPQVDAPGIEPGFGSSGREHIPPPFTGTDRVLAGHRSTAVTGSYTGRCWNTYRVLRRKPWPGIPDGTSAQHPSGTP